MQKHIKVRLSLKAGPIFKKTQEVIYEAGSFLR